MLCGFEGWEKGRGGGVSERAFGVFEEDKGCGEGKGGGMRRRVWRGAWSLVRLRCSGSPYYPLLSLTITTVTVLLLSLTSVKRFKQLSTSPVAPMFVDPFVK